MSPCWKSRAALRAESAWRSSRRASACGCSRSSVSSHDIAASRAEDGLNLEPVVEHDDVGGRAGLEEADVAAGEEARRHLGRRTDRLLERDAERVQVPHRVDHRQHACRRAFRPRASAQRRPRPSTSTSPSWYVPPFAGPGSRHRVGDERDAAGRRTPRRAAPSRRRGGGRRRSSARSRRRGRVSAAPAIPGSRERNGRIALKRCVTAPTPRSKAWSASAAVAFVCPAETDDAALAQPLDQRVGAGQLGRERHLGHAAGVEQAVEQREVGRAQVLERVRARALGREERALEVRAEDARARAVRRHRAQRLDRGLLRRR